MVVGEDPRGASAAYLRAIFLPSAEARRPTHGGRGAGTRVGGARCGTTTATFRGGKFVLRVKVADVDRSTKNPEEVVRNDFSWIGLDFLAHRAPRRPCSSTAVADAIVGSKERTIKCCWLRTTDVSLPQFDIENEPPV